jgi:hypothetical protein
LRPARGIRGGDDERKRRIVRIALYAGAALLVVVLAVLFVASEWKQNAGDLRVNASNATVDAPSAVDSLLAAKTDDIVGQMVFLNNVTVAPGARPDVFFAIGSQGKKILVIGRAQGPIAANAKVDVQGAIRKVPSARVLRTDWQLSRAEVRLVTEQGIYIAADRIRPERAQ